MSWLCNFHIIIYLFKKKNPNNASGSVYFIVKVEKPSTNCQEKSKFIFKVSSINYQENAKTF